MGIMQVHEKLSIAEQASIVLRLGKRYQRAVKICLASRTIWLRASRLSIHDLADLESMGFKFVIQLTQEVRQ